MYKQNPYQSEIIKLKYLREYSSYYMTNNQSIKHVFANPSIKYLILTRK